MEGSQSVGARYHTGSSSCVMRVSPSPQDPVVPLSPAAWLKTPMMAAWRRCVCLHPRRHLHHQRRPAWCQCCHSCHSGKPANQKGGSTPCAMRRMRHRQGTQAPKHVDAPAPIRRCRGAAFLVLSEASSWGCLQIWSLGAPAFPLQSLLGSCAACPEHQPRPQCAARKERERGRRAGKH